MVNGDNLAVRNPHFVAILERMRELHDRKSHDYADNNNVYSNFEFAANTSGVKVVQVFLVLVGVKLARLLQLTSGKNPKNETIEDTFLDLCNYCVLMYAYWLKQKDIAEHTFSSNP